MTTKQKRVSSLKLGAVTDTTKVEFASANHGSMYQPVIEAVERLAVNKSITVPLPAGVSSKSMHNRLTMAFQRTPPTLKPGTLVRKGTDVKGNVVISVLAVKKGKKTVKKASNKVKRKPAKKSKRKAPASKPVESVI